MRFKVFIENEAGSNRKNHHNERTLTFEQAETVSLTDRNVLARVGAEQPELNEVHSTLTEFVQNVFGHMPGRTVVAGRFLGRETAEAEIAKCRVDVDRP